MGREEFSREKKLLVHFPKWFVDWDVITSLFSVIFAHSTVSLHCCCCRFFPSINCHSQTHPMCLAEVMIVFVLINHSWKSKHRAQRKKVVRSPCYIVREKISNNWKMGSNKCYAKNEVVCAQFCVMQDYPWIPLCRISLTLLLPFPFFIRHGLSSFVVKLASVGIATNNHKSLHAHLQFFIFLSLLFFHVAWKVGDCLFFAVFHLLVAFQNVMHSISFSKWNGNCD